MKKVRVTQKMIADALGVSVSTVGLVVGRCETRGEKKLSKETVARIEAKALEMGYYPDRSAQSMRRGRSNLVGIIHFGRVSESTDQAIKHVSAGITAKGYDLMSIDLSWHGGGIERVLEEMIQARVEGVVITHMVESFGKKHTAILMERGIPVVSVNGDERMGVPMVCDDVAGIFTEMVEHLVRVGHKRILLMVNESETRPSRERRYGFMEGIRKVGGEVWRVDGGVKGLRMGGMKKTDRLRHGEEIQGVVWNFDAKQYGYDYSRSGYELIKELLQQGDLPDVVMCTNDAAAFGGISICLEQGMRIPEDLAITGYGDAKFGRFPFFGLTTVKQNMEKLCEEAIRMLMERLEGKDAGIERKFLPASLIVRSSCGQKRMEAGIIRKNDMDGGFYKTSD